MLENRPIKRQIAAAGHLLLVICSSECVAYPSPFMLSFIRHIVVGATIRVHILRDTFMLVLSISSFIDEYPAILR